jgi:hypothetical protein
MYAYFLALSEASSGDRRFYVPAKYMIEIRSLISLGVLRNECVGRSMEINFIDLCVDLLRGDFMVSVMRDLYLIGRYEGFLAASINSLWSNIFSDPDNDSFSESDKMEAFYIFSTEKILYLVYYEILHERFPDHSGPAKEVCEMRELFYKFNNAS